MLKWEKIDHNVDRAEIFGGWLVRSTNEVFTLRSNDIWDFAQTGYEFRDSITFVPDPNHEWRIGDER